MTLLNFLSCKRLSNRNARVFRGASYGLILLFLQPLKAQQPPNVLFVLAADQHRIAAADPVRMPVLGRLQQSGSTLNPFFRNPNAALARAELLTGRYALLSGVCGDSRRREVLRSEAVTMAELFRAANYQTAFWGRWLNGLQFPNDPASQGFVANRVDPADFAANLNGWNNNRLTEEALDFIAHVGQNPFFGLMAFDLPPTLMEHTPPTDSLLQNIDHNLGRLLDALDKLGIAGKTLVVVLSANGSSEAGYLNGAPGTLYEGGLRSNCCFYWPGRIPAGNLAIPTASIDLLPTLLDLCGLPRPDSLAFDGISLAEPLEGVATQPAIRFLYHWCPNDSLLAYPGAMRYGKYTLLMPDRNSLELYDVETDPGQQHDLSDELMPTAKQLARYYRSWIAALPAQMPACLPVPVGRVESPQVRIPATDAVAFFGGLQIAKGDNFVTGFSAPSDSISWPLSVSRGGHFGVWMNVRADPVWANSKWQLDCGPTVLEFLLPLKNGKPGKDHLLHLYAGEIVLNAGEQRLSMHLQKPVSGSLALQSIELERK